MIGQSISRFAMVMLLAFAGCAEQDRSSGDATLTTMDEDIEAIKQLAAEWRSGWLAGDAELLLSLYAVDPVILPQDQPAVVGKDAIRLLYKAVLKEYEFESEATVKEVVVSGDLGYFWSAYTLTAIPKAGGEPTKVTGKSLYVVKRSPSGAWKIALLMDNSDGATTGENIGKNGNDRSANGRQPIRSETNRSSGATGSRR